VNNALTLKNFAQVIKSKTSTLNYFSIYQELVTFNDQSYQMSQDEFRQAESDKINQLRQLMPGG
jgi:hypothetical protein